MLNASPGWIEPRLALIGTADVPLYVIVNDEAATLIEGGLSGMTALVWQQLHDLLRDFGGIRHLRYWLITHSHYDHCSLLMTLKSRMPWLHVSGSPDAFDAFQSPSACRTIRQLDEHASRSWEPAAGADFTELADLPFYPVNPGAQLDIGDGMQIRTIALPGHSRCQFGYYCPQLDIGFVSDALGEFQDATHWLPLVFQDLFAYRHSLDAIEQLHAPRLALGHHGILTGELARSAARHARACLDAREADARAVRGNAAATQALAHQWTARYAARSEKVVPRFLHLKSMTHMIDLFHRAE
ncbi:TPA: MBL fold metallo-hydrolase [Burkholderia cepacia]|uniref:MBL fold metallo-hydrolase n=1 Tax=Burkholderia cepacia TaxID=292 RepID=UPI000755AF72|nr:MBL fold metallo-hydrolase [Burkholderia cepacia]HDR9756987.1 MBL fold metallo-hydrolase [Burkholderia cepacia ATCC 25416]KVH71639.1 MBL fold metallo-hydrolase [Burkholderia cepacia]KVS35161.1 MBL fold metallo-hydrolase [Burkholderia cepacia]KWC66114.1 MBL fold metallo-hydrolase [Burkholderia cepacia]MCA8120204.1 MBL fold metallo-hydrolase [Burkholderia cepacia]